MSYQNPIILRVYADTSVFGAVFEEEPFASASREFFDRVLDHQYRLVISPVLIEEINGAPLYVRELYERVRSVSEFLEDQLSVIDLRDSYIKHGILTPKWSSDALHVAAATVAHCKIVVSWNFKHIVNYKRIRLFNAVNAIMGYDAVAIHTPFEVGDYE